MKRYRYAGYFLIWIRDNYDSNALRKFNLSTLLYWSTSTPSTKYFAKIARFLSFIEDID